MSPTRYVIVGGSAAGMAAAQSIRELDAHGDILILSAEADAPYYRPLIPYIVTQKKTAEEIALMGQGPYTARTSTCGSTRPRLAWTQGPAS